MSEQKNITIAEAGIIWDEIKKAKRILMHCHPSPDGDSIGSTLAMKHALTEHFKKENVEKEITVIKGDSDLPSYLSHLPGFQTIVKKNILEIDLTQFDLFLILDTGDIGRVSRLPEIPGNKLLIFPENLKTIVIDHHKTNPGFAEINLIDATYTSVCHMLFDLFTQWKLDIPHDAALCMFIGIYTDTGAFKYQGSSSRVLEIASELAKIAPDFTSALFSLDNSNTKGRLLLQGLMLTSIETFFSDSIAFAAVSFDTLQKNHITDEEAMGVDVANALKSVISWNVGISALEREKGIVKISIRSRDPINYDISKLAMELGGGGHAGAAGTRIYGTVEEAKSKIIAAIAKVFPHLKQ